MAYVTPANRGNLFKNKEREKETSAEYTGEANIDGILYFMDAWVNDGANGKYFSIKFNKKKKQEGAAQLLDDDIPM